jgi:hypothetical protein
MRWVWAKMALGTLTIQRESVFSDLLSDVELKSKWQQLIALTMLAMASAGPMPLWLHEQVVHCCPATNDLTCAHAHGDAVHGDALSDRSTCPKNHAAERQDSRDGCAQAVIKHPEETHLWQNHAGTCHPGTTQTTGGSGENDRFWHATSPHDCSLCYQLSQSASPVALATTIAMATSLDGGLSADEQRRALAVSDSHRPRGPPPV